MPQAQLATGFPADEAGGDLVIGIFGQKIAIAHVVRCAGGLLRQVVAKTVGKGRELEGVGTAPPFHTHVHIGRLLHAGLRVANFVGVRGNVGAVGEEFVVFGRALAVR